MTPPGTATAARPGRHSARLEPPREEDGGGPARPALWLAAVVLLAAAYHALQSRAHVTPAIFTDELLFSSLAQAFAEGSPFVVRGERLFFPAPLPSLVQAPAWLLADAQSAYSVAKLLNAVVMSTAALSAYWLARQLVRPAAALLAAAATVAAPAMLYHSYLTSEALALPVFLGAVATMMRAIARPGIRWELAVVAASLAAVATRTQFVLLPLAYLVAAPVTARLCGESIRVGIRRHRLSLGLLGGLGATAALTGGAVAGPYFGAALLDYGPADALRLAAWTAVLTAFSAGWIVVPGALVGFALLAARPHGRAEAAFAVLASVTIAGALTQAALVASTDVNRLLERYVIYTVPLLVVAFLRYAERGAPWRRVHAASALALGVTALLVPLPQLSRASFSYDSPTLSAYERLSTLLTAGDAAAIFSGGALLLVLVAAAVPLRPRVAAAFAATAASISLLLGLAAYAGDHEMTSRTLRDVAGSPPDWLDRSGVGEADLLALGDASPHLGWMLEAWNRSAGRTYRLGESSWDALPHRTAHLDADGRLLVEGRPLASGPLVVVHDGARVDLDGRVLLRPRSGVTLYRVPAAPRVRSLAAGLHDDGWAGAVVRYQVWPEGAVRQGVYRMVLELPAGRAARRIELAVDGGLRRSVVLGPGERRVVELPAAGRPAPVLRIRTDRADVADTATARGRALAVRLSTLEYVPISHG